ncbi:MAG TPA: bifunctional shikimate kinase/3-dehydroquinate synthase [Solirubrobacterales bacterium]|nr:bifunctional shikimate kinase/3-dehydroquinate synthase [Solirubrobacterales bacterium]
MAPVAHHGLVFIGFMGAGKTRAAQAAAERLGLGVIDTDDLIEGELGEPIEDFFEREGEQEFRRREERLVVSVLDALAAQVGGPASVVSLGGGAVERVAVQRALAEHLPVWCDVEEEIAWDRASGTGRPLANDREEFARLFAARRPTYEKLARAILPTEARIAAEAAAPWLAAMQGGRGVRMAWAESEGGSYPAIVGEGAIGLLDDAREALPAALPARTFCVADPAALQQHARLLPRSELTIEIEGAESSKTISQADRILRELAGGGARRDDCVLAFGGGVIGDLAGFCAATYQRGVPLVQAPTTLVAQVDSAYGGKTGVDLPEAKNYVGAYHQPIAVLADPTVLRTLSGEELAAGFVEVLKTALIAGGELWERVRQIEVLDPDELGDVIFECARTKIAVVAEDERDSGRRAVLNLGHTVGHGIETASGYGRYRHGEAVGLGLLAALRLSGADDLRTEVEGLLASHALPVSLDASIPVDRIVDAIGRDKKRTSEGIGFVLIERPGEPRWGQSVEPNRVRAAVEELR